MCVSWCVRVLDCIRGLHLLTSVVGCPDGMLVGQTPCAHQEAPRWLRSHTQLYAESKVQGGCPAIRKQTRPSGNGATFLL